MTHEGDHFHGHDSDRMDNGTVEGGMVQLSHWAMGQSDTPGLHLLQLEAVSRIALTLELDRIWESVRTKREGLSFLSLWHGLKNGVVRSVVPAPSREGGSINGDTSM